jgi:hypothetical protein
MLAENPGWPGSHRQISSSSSLITVAFDIQSVLTARDMTYSVGMTGQGHGSITIMETYGINGYSMKYSFIFRQIKIHYFPIIILCTVCERLLWAG